MTKKNANSGIPDESASDRVYFDLIKEAYPQPSENNINKIMAEVRSQRISKSLTDGKKKSNYRTIIRWISVAACFVLVFILSIGLITNSQNGMISDKAAENHDAILRSSGAPRSVADEHVPGELKDGALTEGAENEECEGEMPYDYSVFSQETAATSETMAGFVGNSLIVSESESPESFLGDYLNDAITTYTMDVVTSNSFDSFNFYIVNNHTNFSAEDCPENSDMDSQSRKADNSREISDMISISDMYPRFTILEKVLLPHN